jgi:hypothetical protein
VNLGIVGDVAHQAKGTSYHLGEDKLQSGAYSARTPRDRAGLTNAASAIDLGRLNGKLGPLRDFSDWLVHRGQTRAPGTRDIREIIWSPDGQHVLRWDRERGASSAPRPGEADNSHLTHTHISFYRDSESREKVGLFSPYFTAEPAPLPPLQTGDIVETFTVPTVPTDGNLAKNVSLYTTDQLDPNDPARIIVNPGRRMPLVGKMGSGVWAVQYIDGDEVPSGTAYFIRKSDMTDVAPIAAVGCPDPVPCECDDDIADAVEEEQARVRDVLGL